MRSRGGPGALQMTDDTQRAGRVGSPQKPLWLNDWPREYRARVGAERPATKDALEDSAMIDGQRESSSSEMTDLPITKIATGITGFDEVTGGGLPEKRLTAVVGGPGAGKTVFALQMLVNRFRNNGECGIFVAFEEPVVSVIRNTASFGWNLPSIAGSGIRFLNANLPSDVELGGAFDLSGLLANLTQLTEQCGARNIVFDCIDMVLSALQSEYLERKELARLGTWAHLSGVTAVITAKYFASRDRDQLRSDFLQYMTDCVIELSGAWTETTSSRSLRVIKYRGSGFAANPVPLVIGPAGIDVVSFKGTRLDYPTFTTRVSSGIERLDTLLGGGYLCGSSILISGSPGTSKTSLAACFASGACDRGDRAMFVSFDESANQVIANMHSIGLDLSKHCESGALVMLSLMSAGRSPEEHFVTIRDHLDKAAPQCLVVDPLSSLLKASYPFTGRICESLIGEAKSRGVTVLCTSLLDDLSGELELSSSKVSTIADTWIHVSNVAHDGERNRALTIIKSRGVGHSNQVREVILTNEGIDLVDVYVAEGEVLMGSARGQKEAAEQDKLSRELRVYQQTRMTLDQDVAELQAQAERLAGEISRKAKEMAFLDEIEVQRIQRQEHSAKARYLGRQASVNPGNFGKTIPSRK
jgi:circadian clock protein KaiC